MTRTYILISGEGNANDIVHPIGYRFAEDAEIKAMELNNLDWERDVYWRVLAVELTAIE